MPSDCKPVMGSQWPMYMLNNKDRFIEVHSYNSLIFFFFLAAHSKASYKSTETVNQTQLFTSKQLSHPLLKLKHNSAATGVPSSMWPRGAAVGTAGCDIPFLQPPSSQARNPPPPTSLGLPPARVMSSINHHHTTKKPLKGFPTDRLSSRLLQCKEMPINTWSYFHNAK